MKLKYTRICVLWAATAGAQIDITPCRIGIVVDDVKVADASAAFGRIKQRGAEIILPVTYDKAFNVDFFIIEDPDGNMLQFIGPVKTTR